MFGRENETLGGQLSQTMMPPPLHLDPSMLAGAGGGGDEEFPRRDERVPQWSQQETRDFIGIRGDLEKDFTVAKRNKTLWEVVAGKMKELGYRRTPDQCKSKWKNLVNRYKGKETSDPDNGRQFPFFDELHAVFTERANSIQRKLMESDSVSGRSKKRVKRAGRGQSSEDYSEDDDEGENESDEERMTRNSTGQSRKSEREKRVRASAATEKPSRLSYISEGIGNNSSIQEILGHFLQQQQMIDMQWRELMEKRAYERQLFEQEWRQSMEKLERERLMIEQASRERDERRRIREESRSEKRDVLLTTLLDKLIHENHL